MYIIYLPTSAVVKHIPKRDRAAAINICMLTVIRCYIVTRASYAGRYSICMITIYSVIVGTWISTSESLTHKKPRKLSNEKNPFTLVITSPFE